jgi:uncharacterized cupin superfamily protein
MPDKANLFDLELRVDEDDPPGYQGVGYRRVGDVIGARMLGMTVVELPPDTSSCPYHYEIGNEEWIVVLAGTVTLRTPTGEEELGPFDVVCFPDGPEGAHKMTNRTGEPVRFAMLSTKIDPSASVYPDSGKIGIWPETKLFRLGDGVDYWEGEP